MNNFNETEAFVPDNSVNEIEAKSVEQDADAIELGDSLPEPPVAEADTTENSNEQPTATDDAQSSDIAADDVPTEKDTAEPIVSEEAVGHENFDYSHAGDEILQSDDNLNNQSERDNMDVSDDLFNFQDELSLNDDAMSITTDNFSEDSAETTDELVDMAMSDEAIEDDSDKEALDDEYADLKDLDDAEYPELQTEALEDLTEQGNDAESDEEHYEQDLSDMDVYEGSRLDDFDIAEDAVDGNVVADSNNSDIEDTIEDAQRAFDFENAGEEITSYENSLDDEQEHDNMDMTDDLFNFQDSLSIDGDVLDGAVSENVAEDAGIMTDNLANAVEDIQLANDDTAEIPESQIVFDDGTPDAEAYVPDLVEDGSSSLQDIDTTINSDNPFEEDSSTNELSDSNYLDYFDAQPDAVTYSIDDETEYDNAGIMDNFDSYVSGGDMDSGMETGLPETASDENSIMDMFDSYIDTGSDTSELIDNSTDNLEYSEPDSFGTSADIDSGMNDITAGTDIDDMTPFDAYDSYTGVDTEDNSLSDISAPTETPADDLSNDTYAGDVDGNGFID